jgi:hypothetical protein
VNLEGIPYHTKEEEAELQDYIKRQLAITDDNNGMDSLLANHV